MKPKPVTQKRYVHGLNDNDMSKETKTTTTVRVRLTRIVIQPDLFMEILESKISKREKKIMEHSLGLNYRKKPNRNYFFIYAGHESENDLEKLVEKGFMNKRKDKLSDDGIVYRITDAGKAVLGV